MPQHPGPADGYFAYSSNCGRSSVISNHAALEPTKMCLVGRTVGAPTNDPNATCTNAPSHTTEKRKDPHAPQRVSLRSSSPKTATSSSPSVIVSFSRSIPANALKAEPVAARHPEQWQFAAYRNASETS